MRIRLTQRGWNNVLIFASLFMIVLFNVTHQRFVEGPDQVKQRTLFDAEDIIVRVDFSGLLFERFGASWQIKTEQPLQESLAPERYIYHWQHLVLDVSAEDQHSCQKSLAVVVSSQANSGKQIFDFCLSSEGRYSVFDRSNSQWLSIPTEQIGDLVPYRILGLFHA